MSDNLLIRVDESERIYPGDLVERRHSSNGREYKVTAGKDGYLVVKFRFAGTWYTDNLPPAKFHEKWRKVTDTPVLRFLEMVSYKMRETGKHQRYSLFRNAVELAIKAQFKFAPDDFERIAKKYVPYRGEREYSFVIKSGNSTAVTAMEQYMNRAPFWYNPVFHDMLLDGNTQFSRKRLHVGELFSWEGFLVRVTSFAEDGNTLIACRQKHDREAGGTKTIRVFRISRDDLTRFSELRSSLSGVLAWRQDRTKLSLPYRVKDTGDMICSECANADLSWRGHDLHFAEAITCQCSRCSALLWTSPTHEMRVQVLKEIEAILTTATQATDESLLQLVFEDYSPERVAHRLTAVAPLCVEMAYMARVVKIGEALGIAWMPNEEDWEYSYE